MRLHTPFKISARLAPALQIGKSWLSLEGIAYDKENRDRATFVIDFEDGTSYTDKELRSGAGGFKSSVEAFHAFLDFLSAAADAAWYQHSTGRESENADIFPEHVMEWCYQHSDEISIMLMSITDENQETRHHLIEED